MDNKIFIPSLEEEKKTKAFNKWGWSFASLISFFTVWFLWFMIYSISDDFVIESFISNNLLLVFLILILIFLVIALFGRGFFNCLKTSYKIDGNKIIKGIIKREAKANDLNLINSAIATKYTINSIKNSNNFAYAASAFNNSVHALKLISLNMKRDFVEQYFDTDVYKKKIYTNPRVIRETKYFVIYLCDNNKKLKVPKAYPNMNYQTNNEKESSFVSRVLIRILILFFAFSTFFTLDLIVGYSGNASNLNNIEQTYTDIEYNLNIYGYKLQKRDSKIYIFKKENENNISTIQYKIDKKGEIDGVKLELFLDIKEGFDDELRFILESLCDDFTLEEIDKFIQDANRLAEGELINSKLISDKNSIILGKSSSYIHIHN